MAKAFPTKLIAPYSPEPAVFDVLSHELVFREKAVGERYVPGMVGSIDTKIFSAMNGLTEDAADEISLVGIAIFPNHGQRVQGDNSVAVTIQGIHEILNNGKFNICAGDYVAYEAAPYIIGDVRGACMPGINQNINERVPAQKYLPQIFPIKVTTVGAIVDKIRRDVHKTAAAMKGAFNAKTYVDHMDKYIANVFKSHRGRRGHKAIVRLYTIVECLMHYAELCEEKAKTDQLKLGAVAFAPWATEITTRNESELHAFARTMYIDEDATSTYLKSMKEYANWYDYSGPAIKTTTRLAAVAGDLLLAYVDWLRGHVIGQCLKFCTPGKPLDILVGAKGI